jgi:hypothetical protein
MMRSDRDRNKAQAGLHKFEMRRFKKGNVDGTANICGEVTRDVPEVVDSSPAVAQVERMTPREHVRMCGIDSRSYY